MTPAECIERAKAAETPEKAGYWLRRAGHVAPSTARVLKPGAGPNRKARRRKRVAGR